MVTASLIEMIGMSPKKPEYAIKAHKLIMNLDSFEEVLSQSLSSEVVSGTCRTGISEHYQKELETYIKTNFEQMTSLIHDWSEYLAGIQSAKSTNWEWCFRFYTSYTDCPISKNQQIQNFMVAVFNPSLKTVNRTRVAVPPKNNYTVSIFNYTAK
jgi:hypothetical protein